MNCWVSPCASRPAPTRCVPCAVSRSNWATCRACAARPARPFPPPCAAASTSIPTLLTPSSIPTICLLTHLPIAHDRHPAHAHRHPLARFDCHVPRRPDRLAENGSAAACRFLQEPGRGPCLQRVCGEGRAPLRLLVRRQR